MQAPDLKKAGILSLFVVLVIIGCWEFYLRSIGVSNSFDDNEPLWAYKRAQIYDEPERTTFFIGSSRIKFDIDLKTWEDVTGEKPVQLALVGTSPQLILKDLADDKKFKGKLIVDGTEFILFSRDPGDQESAKKSIEYYKKWQDKRYEKWKKKYPNADYYHFLKYVNYATGDKYNNELKPKVTWVRKNLKL